MTDAVIHDKTLRSVFVGNIPYEVTEERLKEIFTNVGPVVSFKLVFDRDSGKPKGYGFCEFKDQETALCAMRNLNNYEICGRTLRVDTACTEKSRLEMQNLMQHSQIENNQYGDYVNPEKAPEVISKAIASLPPEQTYEFIKQMKHCIQNNPHESRQLLLRNPQLGYALLQSLIVMRIMDPQVALSMLHPFNTVPTVLKIPDHMNNITASDSQNTAVTSTSDQHHYWNNVPSSQPIAPLHSGISPQTSTSIVNNIQPPSMQAPPPPPPLIAQDMDMRADLRTGNRFGDQDLRIQPPPLTTQIRESIFDPFGRPNENSIEPRHQYPGPPPPPPLMTGPPHMPVNMHPMVVPPIPLVGQNINNIPRMTPALNSVSRPSLPTVSASPSTASSINSSPASATAASTTATATTTGANPDTEKAALIMQVLQLTDEQIAMLPTEQRQSILILKEQISKSTKR